MKLNYGLIAVMLTCIAILSFIASWLAAGWLFVHRH